MRAGALEAALSPAAGGSLLWLALDGVDLLRRAPDEATDPLAMASFPLVPYANRIADGRFAFAGRSHQLPRNFGDHPHSIHGFGWQAKWTASGTAPSSTRLTHMHAGDAGWPWSYRAEQHVMLTPSQMFMSLSLFNAGDTPMPAGLGFHPYFLADAATTIRFDARSLWLSTPDMLPDREAAADMLGDWSRPAIVRGDTLVDNAYAGWTGPAIVQRGDGLRLTVSATGADFLHVYRPPASNDFCLEPVSHMPDAINRNAMPVLPPGDTARLSMTIAIDKINQTLSKSDGIA
ncbi:aldose 1-epimerase [Sphingobium sp. HBC34]|uniref:Aldose 1-epimerase n=1 Tax=Sphingobium cyanobacteriorum TaxID=3063954 RepID=A0ABT8ZHP5_9SPHN|nr:aldose 1-epimerase [Sphingobium sp. HBC34]MDO7833544.1 aldose 1-epimerase [Sphingobium sp. HBC34]